MNNYRIYAQRKYGDVDSRAGDAIRFGSPGAHGQATLQAVEQAVNNYVENRVVNPV